MNYKNTLHSRINKFHRMLNILCEQGFIWNEKKLIHSHVRFTKLEWIYPSVLIMKKKTQWPESLIWGKKIRNRDKKASQVSCQILVRSTMLAPGAFDTDRLLLVFPPEDPDTVILVEQMAAFFAQCSPDKEKQALDDYRDNPVFWWVGHYHYMPSKYLWISYCSSLVYENCK